MSGKSTIEQVAAGVRSFDAFDDLAEVFSTLGSPSRLRALFLIQQKPEMGVGELADLLGITISGASQHLRRLRHAGLVSCRRDGHTVCCALRGGSRHVRMLRTIFGAIAKETGCCR